MWQDGVRELVRRHQFDFESASREISVDSETLRMEFSAQESSKEAVFDRVLSSLGCEQPSAEIRESRVVEMWREQRAIQAAEAATLEKIQAERAEMKALREQRLALQSEKRQAREEQPIPESPKKVDVHFHTDGLDALLDDIERDYPQDAQCSEELNSLFELFDATQTAARATTTTSTTESREDEALFPLQLPPPPSLPEKRQQEEMNTTRNTGRVLHASSKPSKTTVDAATQQVSRAVLSRSQIYSHHPSDDDDDEDGSSAEEEDDDDASWLEARRTIRERGIR